MSLQALKQKIEANTSSVGGGRPEPRYGFRSGLTQISFTEEEYRLYFNGELSGKYDITLNFSDGSTKEIPQRDAGDYRQAFIEISKISFDRRNYSNLSYNETRLGVIEFPEDSEEFKKVIQNLSNETLGPALSEFSFEKYDDKVSDLVNKDISGGLSFTFSNLLRINISNHASGGTYLVPFSDLEVIQQGSFIDASKWNEIADAYLAENGSDPRLSEGTIKASDSAVLQGRVSGITTEFRLAELEAGGGRGIFGFLKDLFTDYKSPSKYLDLSYKAFLVDSLREPANIDSNFNNSAENTALQITENLVYDFEYERRLQLFLTIQDNPDAPVDDILDTAEAAALDALGGSGLAGEGGFERELSDEDIESRQKFYQQCVLLANMDKLKDTFNNIIRTEGAIEESENQTPVEKMHQPLPYQERFYMVGLPLGKNDRLVNFLNAPTDDTINDFLNITPEIQAFLTPKIRLYKVFNEGRNLKQVEFIFRNATDSTDILKTLFRDNDKFFRGSGFGIKDFSFSFNGTTPATAKNDITANLTLFFQDFSDFITPIETTQGTFRFVDLIFFDKKDTNNPTFGYGASHPDQYSPAYFRIRADVGWRVPTNDPQFNDACRKRGIDPDNVRDVIEKTNRSYYLNMVEHELDFKKDGTIEIKAQYRGYIESVLKGTSMDALTDQALIDERKSRQLQLEAAKRTCTPGELAKIKRIYAAEESVVIEDLYQRTYKRLLDLGKVRTFIINSDGGFRSEGYFVTRPEIEDGGTDRIQVIGDEDTYYFLGDLLYVMLDSMYADNNRAEPINKTRFIMPTIEFENFFDDSGVFAINIAQIPISHRYFDEWWTEHVVKANKRTYAIMFYLRDLLNDLVADTLIDTCLNRDYRKSFNFQTTTVSASDDPLSNKASITEPIIVLDQNELPFAFEEGSDINDMTNYILVYPAFSTTLPSGTGQYVEDLENGVYHFHLGQDRGIIHDVKFSKVDMSYIREARYQREGVDGLLQLGAVYRANLTMFGNTLFYPGMLIYINPFGIGGEQFLPNRSNSIANKLGLGGYHIIEKVDSVISSGMFKTTVNAMFVYSGDGDTRFNVQGKEDETQDTDVEESSAESPTCSNLVTSVRTSYLDALRGQESLEPTANIEQQPSPQTAQQYTNSVALTPTEAAAEETGVQTQAQSLGTDNLFDFTGTPQQEEEDDSYVIGGIRYYNDGRPPTQEPQ